MDQIKEKRAPPWENQLNLYREHNLKLFGEWSKLPIHNSINGILLRLALQDWSKHHWVYKSPFSSELLCIIDQLDIPHHSVTSLGIVILSGKGIVCILLKDLLMDLGFLLPQTCQPHWMSQLMETMSNLGCNLDAALYQDKFKASNANVKQKKKISSGVLPQIHYFGYIRRLLVFAFNEYSNYWLYKSIQTYTGRNG